MNFRVICLVLLFQFIIIGLQAQDKQYIYYFDENLGTVSKEKAIITGKGFIEGNNFRLDCFLNATNQLLLVATFVDSSLQIFNGPYTLYDGKNNIKEEGSYVKDIKEGIWKSYDKSGKITDSTIYENGIRIKFAKYRYYYKENNINGQLKTDSSQYSIDYEFTDSLKNEFVSQYYSLQKGGRVLERDVFFLGNKGVVKKYDSLQNVTIDSVFNRKEKEAEYYGGDTGWRELLVRNLKVDVGINNGAPPGVYRVIVKFVVEVDGSIGDLTLENDPGFGMGKEALRVIKLATKWKPAIQYGRPVRAYRRQPITFQISEETRR